MAGEVTQWLRRLADGEEQALDRLIPLLYDDLRRLAGQRLRKERAGHTLSATALVNEAYLRLLRRQQIHVDDRSQFLAVASETMRRLLVDYARSRNRKKRGGGEELVPLHEVEPILSSRGAEEVVELDEALSRLHEVHPRAAQVVQHRLFGGLELAESADVLGVSRKTVQRDWTVAIAWLRSEIARDLRPLEASFGQPDASDRGDG